VAFVFQGVGDERPGILATGGGVQALSLMCGPELDAGKRPGSAQSRNLTNTYLIVPEEFLETAPGLGADENGIARADMVFFAMPKAAVFSVGLIAWAGSLPR
jgi:hypothetical protein